MPKISFLLSVYNGAKFLEKRLDNLLNQQTEKDIEVVIVNPNSQDSTHYIADKWVKQEPDRIQYIQLDYLEPYGESWVRAWRAAKSDIVCNSNVDDLIHNTFSEKLWHTAKSSNNNIAFWYTGIQVVDENYQMLNYGIKPPFNWEQMSYECVAGPCVGFRADDKFMSKMDWSLINYYAKEYTSAFDYYLWLYFMSFGYHGYSIQEILTVYMQRSDSIENRRKSQNTYEALASISQFFNCHFQSGGRLYESYPEFADFENLPLKEEWITKRENGESWNV